MATGISARLSRAEARQFGLLVGAAFLVFSAVLWWRGRHASAVVFSVVGAALILFGVALPDALVPVRRLWMGMAAGISKVTTPIFMGVVYFGVFTPIGMVRRLAGRSPLRPRSTDGSLWVSRGGEGKRPADMEHQF